MNRLLFSLTLSAALLSPSVSATAAPSSPRKPLASSGKKTVERVPLLLKEETPKEFLGENCSITLERAFERTLATDQSIRIAYSGIRKANLRPWSALTRLGPSLTGNLGYQTGSRYSQVDPLIETTRTDTVSRSASLTFVQPLFDPTAIPAFKNGRLAAQSARLQYQYTIRETLFGVVQAYYDVLKQQSLVSVNRVTETLAKEQLDQAQNRFEVGDVARIDVLRAQATLEDARNQTILSQGSLDIARNTLSNILNLGGETNFVLTEPEKAPEGETPYELALKQAYAGREDLKMSLIAVEQERTFRQELLASYSPRVSAQASAQWGSSNGPGSGRNEAQVGVINVQVPFLTGGQREIDIRNAGHLINEAQLRVENTSKAIETDVKVAWIHVNTGRKSLEALRASVAASEQNYADLKSQYEAGAATSLDVQVALRELSNSRTALTNQIYDYQIAVRNFERAQAIFEQSRVHRKSGLPLIQS